LDSPLDDNSDPDNDYGVEIEPQLFSSFDDHLDFDAPSANQAQALANGLDRYWGFEGNDVVSLPSSGTSVPGGYDPTAWFNGGSGADTIIGRDRDDLIDGGSGKDTLSGDQGSDTINGGKGKDTIDGGKGDDGIAGGKGDDSLEGGPGRDTVAYSDGSFSANQFAANRSDPPAGRVVFGDYTFDFRRLTSDSDGTAGVKVKIEGPEGSDVVSNAEFFSHNGAFMPLAKVDVYVERTGDGTGKLWWKLNGVIQGSKETIYYDETLATKAGDYVAVYRTNAGNGKVLEFPDYLGKSEFGNAQYVQIHGGNHTTNSASCVVGTKKAGTPLGELLRSLDSLTVQLGMDATTRTTVNDVATNSPFLHFDPKHPGPIEKHLKFGLSGAENDGSLSFKGYEEFYRLPIPITVHLKGDVPQPRLRLKLKGDGAIDAGQTEKLTLSLAHFDDPNGLDRDIIVHLRVTADRKNAGYLSLTKNGAPLTDPDTTDKVKDGYEVTIKHGVQNPKQSFFFHADTGKAANVAVEVIGYEVHIPNHHVYTPPGQAMLDARHSEANIALNGAPTALVANPADHDLIVA